MQHKFHGMFIRVYMWLYDKHKGWDMKRPNLYRFLIGVVSGFGSLKLPARRWKFDTNTGELTNASFGFIANQQRDLWIYESMTGWWFRTFFIFPYIGNNDPNWLYNIFQRGWNHQPDEYSSAYWSKMVCCKVCWNGKAKCWAIFLFASFASWILSTIWVLELGTPTFTWRRIKQFWGNGFEYSWSLETRTGPHSCIRSVPLRHSSNRHGMDAGVPNADVILPWQSKEPWLYLVIKHGKLEIPIYIYTIWLFNIRVAMENPL